MGPDIATITSSLARSLQNCSLTNGEVSPENHLSGGAALDLNSQSSLPYHWEQCLDLKDKKLSDVVLGGVCVRADVSTTETGEVYYINWRTGMKAKEDLNTTTDVYSEEDESDNDYDDDSSYDDTEESSSESSPISCSSNNQIRQHDHYGDKLRVDDNKRENVLVVVGCKSCLMYLMVPKHDSICPKCYGQLLHFDQPEHGSV